MSDCPPQFQSAISSWIFNCAVCYWFLSTYFFFSLCLTAFPRETRTLLYDEPYYEYVPDHLQWNSAAELCNQRSGALATVSNPVENQELTSFLKSLNISQPVWIAREVKPYLTSRFSVPFVTFYIKILALFLSNSWLFVFFHILAHWIKG